MHNQTQLVYYYTYNNIPQHYYYVNIFILTILFFIMKREELLKSLNNYIELHYFPKSKDDIGSSLAEPWGKYSNAQIPDLRSLDAGFCETLLKMIAEKHISDADFYERANLSRQVFNRLAYIRDYKPTKSTALACAIGLGLNLEETKDLLSRAGFAISHSSAMDVIVEFFIVNGEYDIHLINETLYDYDLQLLGSY